MASIRKREAKDGSINWQVEVRSAGLKPIYKTFDNQFDAERFLVLLEKESKVMAKKAKPAPIDVRTEQLKKEKIVDVIARFVRSDEVKQRHLNITPTIVLHVGEATVGDITKSWVRRFVKHMRAQTSRQGRPYADATIAAFIWTMNVAIRWRADDLDIPDLAIPLTVQGISGKWDIKRERRLESYEQDALLDRMDRIETTNREHWKLLTLLALETAARLQELVKCEWKEVDISRRVWMIPANHTKIKKTRAVPMNDFAVKIFTRLKEISDPSSSRVFHAIGNKPQCVTACFHRYVKQAGIIDFRFHDLRHEAISRMALYWRQFTMFELMLIVGHTRMEMFQRYANLRADELASKFQSTTINI